MIFKKNLFKERFFYWLERSAGSSGKNADARQLYEAVTRALVDHIGEAWQDCEQDTQKNQLKRVYYFSAEFLMGRALGNNLLNLGWEKTVAKVLEEMGFNLNAAEDSETDAALGSGGLGRLAACFMESLATLNFPARGYGIRYRYGMFKQEIRDGKQGEQPDNWILHGDPWSVRRINHRVIVPFGGYVETQKNPDGSQSYTIKDSENICAIPFDMPIIGWATSTVNTLRLWEAESINGFNLDLFNDMEYHRAVETHNRALDLSRVLYPNDSGPKGKILRLRQQYFFSSASLQDIINEHKNIFKHNIKTLPKMAAIQLNDTHPVIAIPELMRLLMDKEGLGWDEAWGITTKIFAYTNHTIMAEALEKWPINFFRSEFPRLLQIIGEIDRRFMKLLKVQYPHDHARHNRMAILSDETVNMVRLAAVGSLSINGVAALHTKILKKDTLKDWHKLWPSKFNNKTNGVTQRRWLGKANPLLSQLLNEVIGPEWITNLSLVKNLKAKAHDTAILERLGQIKATNKRALIQLSKAETGLILNPASLFDIQIKRFHEYKRQLLNVLSLIHDWQALQADPSLDVIPRSIFFGGKAASGYHRAKKIIHLIHALAFKINKDPQIRDRLKIVFIPNYCVSNAEILIPAAEISQQISTAGKEASGTGNMKFMMNGAITLGTLDGANLEIIREVGKENAFVFGMTKKEVEEINKSDEYQPQEILAKDPALKNALDCLIDGRLSSGDDFRELYDSLVYGIEGNNPDEYFLLQDFASYRQMRQQANEAWKDQIKWNRMALYNIAGSGKFSSDRTIKEYASEIWKIYPRQGRKSF